MLLSSNSNLEVVEMDWPKVRVLWHGAYGSTYQRYTPSRRGQPITSRFGLGCPSPDDEESVFSQPLTCPSCRGSLELEQLDADSPDRLLGSCSDCKTWAIFDVESGGRLTLSMLRN